VNALVSSLIVQNHALVARSRITSHHDQLVQRPRLMSTPPFPSGLRVERGEAAAVFGATRELNLSRLFKAFPVWPDHIGTRFEHPLPNCLCHSPLLNGHAAPPLSIGKALATKACTNHTPLTPRLPHRGHSHAQLTHFCRLGARDAASAADPGQHTPSTLDLVDLVRYYSPRLPSQLHHTFSRTPGVTRRSSLSCECAPTPLLHH
jgi:hypothetical protein